MKKLIIFFSCLCLTLASFANNVIISNISLVGSPGNYKVQFDLSWENGWRVSTAQNNYDGVWVFFKYRLPGGEWRHLTMTGIGNSIPVDYASFQNSGLTKTGAIIHRANNFTGTASLADIELGITNVGFGFDIRGYAIEMVFIPLCNNCILGDGNGISESISALHLDSADNTSGALESKFSVDINTSDDALLKDGIFIHTIGITDNTNYTTGKEFWSMKYELSQGAYRDFLNALNLTQQTVRTTNAPTSAIGTGALFTSGLNRNYLEIAVPSAGGTPAVYGLDASGNNIFDEASDGEWVACNYLSWPDIAAYLDWAGLAPMTEIMYERICRGASTLGANPSVLGEYAWGTNAINFFTYTLVTPFTATETASNASTTEGNANHTNLTATGPLRNGIFATATSNRITSGAAFYGVMEMTGNLLEPCISIGNIAGRGFTSINGDGILSVNGNANVANWPCGLDPAVLPVCSEVTSMVGTIIRGGSQGLSRSVSRRDDSFVQNQRTPQQGCRGVLYIYY